MESRIGIAISTRNRREAFYTTYINVLKYLPDGAIVVVVDDASSVPCHVANYRFKKQVGISTVKNKCLSLLHERGCDHFFLFDSDTHPITKGWYNPYIESGINHLCYTFLNHTKVNGNIKYHNLGNGCALYMTRKAIDTIGGFDTKLYNKYEHVQWSYRAYASGLITHPFIDVVGSDKLIYCMDQDNSVKRTMSPKEMATQLNNNRGHYYKTRMSTEFVPYK